MAHPAQPQPPSQPEALLGSPVRLSDMRRMPRIVYPMRVLGMALGVLPLGVILWQSNANWLPWLWFAITGFIWPQLAYLFASRAADPMRVERRNLLLDAWFAGTCLPLMQFNLLPSVMLVSVVTADRLNTGIRNLWLQALPLSLLGVIMMGVLTGFAARIDTSMTVIWSCLPMLIVHLLAVSLTTHRLVRRVQTQNRQLDQLTKIDPLTGLFNRRQWQIVLEDALGASQNRGEPVALMLLDIDSFKSINDEHGHGVGDEVLCAIANEIRSQLREGDHAGRLGGDEFAAIHRSQDTDIEGIAELLCQRVAELRLDSAPELRCSISIGLAMASPEAQTKDWLAEADRALYRAKQAGRNRWAWNRP